MINSYIYNGTVIHKRFKPKEHYFKYKVFSLLINLSELEELNKKISFFSLNKFNLISFYEGDHGARDGSSLADWVKQNLKANNIITENIEIKLLCYPRILGYVFNPLSVFFIYDKAEKLISILYEVKNTFGEQHTYVFRVENENRLLKPILSRFCNIYIPYPSFQITCSYFLQHHYWLVLKVDATCIFQLLPNKIPYQF